MYWLGSVVVVHARRCDAVCKMWRVLRIGLMSFATRPGQPWCRGLVAVHWTSLRRRRGWSYEVLMLSRSTVWSMVAGRYSIPGPSYTAPCTIGHRTYLSTLNTG